MNIKFVQKYKDSFDINNLQMVQKFKDAANILKAKFKKDDLEESLIQVTSEQNWQAPTNMLHQIANASYNYEKCQQITQFIWDKLKTKSSWRKILKTLNLVQFLLKNGPPSIISTFKYEIYQFKSFLDYSHFSDNAIDRGEAIRERAKSVVQLLSNEQILQEQRTKAKTIRQKMSGISGGSSYGSYGGDSKYQNYDSKSYGKNDTYSNTDKSNLNTAYGGYTSNQSTLAKYKQKQANKDSKTSQNKSVVDITGSSTKKPQQKADAQEQQAPKPFSQPIKKLMKPGQKPTEKASVNIIGNPSPIPTTPTQKQTQNQAVGKKQASSLLDDDILGFSNPVAPPPKQQAPLVVITPTLINPIYGTTAQMAAQNVQQTQAQQNLHNINLVNPMYGTTAPLAVHHTQHQPQQQLYGNQMYGMPTQMPPQNQQMNYINPMYGTTAPIAAQNVQYQQYGQPNLQMGQQNWQFNAPQSTHMNINPMYGQTAPMAAQQQHNLTTGITLSNANKKNDDQFGGFQSGNSSNQNVKWLNQKEKGLIDFSDFSSELKKTDAKATGSGNGGNTSSGWEW